MREGGNAGVEYFGNDERAEHAPAKRGVKMPELTCISPIDGSVFATRKTLSAEGARAAIAETRAAQANVYNSPGWRRLQSRSGARPMAARASPVMCCPCAFVV